MCETVLNICMLKDRRSVAPPKTVDITMSAVWFYSQPLIEWGWMSSVLIMLHHSQTGLFNGCFRSYEKNIWIRKSINISVGIVLSIFVSMRLLLNIYPTLLPLPFSSPLTIIAGICITVREGGNWHLTWLASHMLLWINFICSNLNINAESKVHECDFECIW